MEQDERRLDQLLRSARSEFELSPDFDRRVMAAIAGVKPAAKRKPGPIIEFRTAGASLIVAGFLILFLNVTPFGSQVQTLAVSVKSATAETTRQSQGLGDRLLDRIFLQYDLIKEDAAKWISK
ncbi:MAG: hypothetical protein ACM3QZ_07015 [Solirubrobacterales bacterium]